MDDNTTPTHGTGKKGGKQQGTIEIEKGTMKLKGRLQVQGSSSTLRLMSGSDPEEPKVKKIKQEEDVNKDGESGEVCQKGRLQAKVRGRK